MYIHPGVEILQRSWKVLVTDGLAAGLLGRVLKRNRAPRQFSTNQMSLPETPCARDATVGRITCQAHMAQPKMRFKRSSFRICGWHMHSRNVPVAGDWRETCLQQQKRLLPRNTVQGSTLKCMCAQASLCDVLANSIKRRTEVLGIYTDDPGAILNVRGPQKPSKGPSIRLILVHLELSLEFRGGSTASCRSSYCTEMRKEKLSWHPRTLCRFRRC